MTRILREVLPPKIVPVVQMVRIPVSLWLGLNELRLEGTAQWTGLRADTSKNSPSLRQLFLAMALGKRVHTKR